MVSPQSPFALPFHWFRIVCLVAASFSALFAAGQVASGGAAALKRVPQSDRIATVDSSVRTQIAGHIPAWAQQTAPSSTPVDDVTPLRLKLLLRRSSAAEQALQILLVEQQTPGSPMYHQAVSPEQLGVLYGPTAHDIEAIEQWAQSRGFIVGAISPSRMTLDLTGSASTIESAFAMHFSMYTTADGTRRAPDTEPQVPTALSPVIDGVGGLIAEDGHPLFVREAASESAVPGNSSPLFTGIKGNRFVTPADFAKIYDITPIYTGNNTGATIGTSAQHLAIIASSDANAADVQAFFTGINSTSYKYNVVLADDMSPGYTKSQGEAELDLERVLGTAPGVMVDLVEGAGTAPLYDAASYAINVLKDPIITMSFGNCEANLTATGAKMWQDLWATAAVNMASVFVSAGDAGAAGCDMHGSAPPATQMLGVNGFCSTQSNTCVGGTEFNDGGSPSLYWSTTNDPNTKASVLSYIPEGAWNDSVRTDASGSVTYVASSGGGGVSQFVTKPSYQTGTGVPSDGFRDIPDISFTASPLEDPYYYCGPGQCTVTGQANGSTFTAFGEGGTSASAPSMAAITALLNTAAGAPQGNVNMAIYRLANSAVAAQVFHDVTLASSGVTNCDVNVPSLCNNSIAGPDSPTVMGQPGYLVGTGYDLATGWGSLDVTNFIKGAIPIDTTIALTTTGTAVSTTQTITATATLEPAGSSLAPATGTIQFFVNGTATGSPVTLTGSTATSAAISFPATGTDSVTAVYSGDALYVPSTSAGITVVVTATPPTFTLAASPASLSFTSGSTTGTTSTVTLTSANGFAGTAALTCSITSSTAAFQPTSAVAPGSVTLAVNGSASAIVTIASTVAQADANPALLPNGSGHQLVVTAGFTSLLAFVGLMLLPRRRRPLPALAAALAVFATLGGMLTGCSGGGSKAPLRSSSGSYTVTVTGTGTGAGAITATTATTTFAVTIN